MYKKDFILTYDLYGRNATIFNKILNNIKGNISVYNHEKHCNAKSLIGILSMGLRKNTKITMISDNPDFLNFFENTKCMLIKSD